MANSAYFVFSEKNTLIIEEQISKLGVDSDQTGVCRLLSSFSNVTLRESSCGLQTQIGICRKSAYIDTKNIMLDEIGRFFTIAISADQTT